MGYRLSLYVLPKEVHSKLKTTTDSGELWKSTRCLERMKYDYCTDAMLDVQKEMLRLTDKVLDCECDITLGVMDKEHFKVFMNSILKYARRQWEFKRGDPDFWKWECPADDKWSITKSTDWVGAYFEAMFILKMFDWDNNVAMFIIS